MTVNFSCLSYHLHREELSFNHFPMPWLRSCLSCQHTWVFSSKIFNFILKILDDYFFPSWPNASYKTMTSYLIPLYRIASLHSHWNPWLLIANKKIFVESVADLDKESDIEQQWLAPEHEWIGTKDRLSLGPSICSSMELITSDQGDKVWWLPWQHCCHYMMWCVWLLWQQRQVLIMFRKGESREVGRQGRSSYSN